MNQNEQNNSSSASPSPEIKPKLEAVPPEPELQPPQSVIIRRQVITTAGTIEENVEEAKVETGIVSDESSVVKTSESPPANDLNGDEEIIVPNHHQPPSSEMVQYDDEQTTSSVAAVVEQTAYADDSNQQSYNNNSVAGTPSAAENVIATEDYASSHHPASDYQQQQQHQHHQQQHHHHHHPSVHHFAVEITPNGAVQQVTIEAQGEYVDLESVNATQYNGHYNSNDGQQYLQQHQYEQFQNYPIERTNDSDHSPPNTSSLLYRNNDPNLGSSRYSVSDF